MSAMQKSWRLSVLLGVVLCALDAGALLSAEPNTPPLVIADKDHTPVIIHADNWKQSAWYDWGGQKILQRYLELVTDSKIPVVSASQLTDELRAQHATRIWVGRQPEVERVLGEQLDKLDDDGFIIRAIGSDVYVAGKHWWGDNWAAHDLLEQFAGCRWYGPEPAFWKPTEEGMVGLFDIIPRRARVEMPAELVRVEEPSYKMRWYRFMPQHSFRLRYRDQFHHALVGIMPPAKYGKEHPEYFPLINGERRVPAVGHEHHFQPCVSNPEVIALVADAAITHFREHPLASAYSVGMNDTSTFCECEKCLAIAPAELKEKDQRLAYAFFAFYNQVAERVAREYPDKRLGCLAYAGLSVLPRDAIRLHPMLVPYLTRDSAQLFAENEQQEFRDIVTTWNRLATRMGIYEYLYGGGFVVPRIYNRYLIRNVQERYGVGVDGFYAESYPNWGLDGPKYWLLARMLWDCEQDPETLLSEYYANLFGPAAASMRAYFDYLEEVWCTQTLDSNRSNYRWFLDAKQLEIFAPPQCEHAWELLAQAESQTDDPLIRKRIAYFKDSLAVTRALSQRYHAVANLDRVMSETAAAELEAGLPQRLAALQASLDAPDAEALYQQAPAGAFDTNVAQDIRRYDRQPVDAVAQLVQQVVAQAVDGQSDVSPDAVRTRIAQTLAAAKSPNDSAAPAAKFIEMLASTAGVLPVAHLVKPPQIDGEIAAGEWPAAAAQRQFFQVHRVTTQEEMTTIYAGWSDRRLYLAFDCVQAPETVGGEVREADRGGWRNAEMLKDDCISLTFKRGACHSLRVNAYGALGFGEPTWDGVATAKSRVTDTGWQTELAIDMDKLGLQPQESPQWTMAIARYLRRPAAPDNDVPTWQTEVATLLPAPHGVGIIGQGNHPGLMTFVTGPRLLFATPTKDLPN